MGNLVAMLLGNSSCHSIARTDFGHATLSICVGFPSHGVDFVFPLVWAFLGPNLLG